MLARLQDNLLANARTHQPSKANIYLPTPISSYKSLYPPLNSNTPTYKNTLSSTGPTFNTKTDTKSFISIAKPTQPMPYYPLKNFHQHKCKLEETKAYVTIVMTFTHLGIDARECNRMSSVQ